MVVPFSTKQAVHFTQESQGIQQNLKNSGEKSELKGGAITNRIHIKHGSEAGL